MTLKGSGIKRPVEEVTYSDGSCGGSTYDEEFEHPIDEELSDAANGEHIGTILQHSHVISFKQQSQWTVAWSNNREESARASVSRAFIRAHA